MPATRLRNEFWHRSLQQVYERGGALEISVPSTTQSTAAPGAEGAVDQDRLGHCSPGNLVWRVRILSLTADDIVVEAPVTLGEVVPIEKGIDLVAVLAIGQNRWMFSTRVLDRETHPLTQTRTVSALRLRMPDKVERCQRRSFYRVSTLSLSMPRVSCWPLLDLHSAVLAEKANELRFINTTSGAGSDRSASPTSSGPRESAESFTLPEVGPRFEASLINVGGGGIGLLLEPDVAGAISRHRLFWISINLTPSLEAPIAVAAKLVHTHIDSSQKTYAGLAFEFCHHKEHQKFVVSQLCRYVTLQQQAQMTQLRQAS